MFRVNVDWDSHGLDLLERWCECFGIRPTLAIAGCEIQGHEKRIKDFVERTGADIAGHSWSHRVVLPCHGVRRQREEVLRNKTFLEDLTGREVNGFVAPYIKYDRRTFDVLADSGHHWFIRSWSVHPVPLAGFDLLDLGVNFYFSPGWEEISVSRLALSDLVFQLHLTDLPRLEAGLERALVRLHELGVRYLSCQDYYREMKTGGLV